jgi:hypothetical protein
MPTTVKLTISILFKWDAIDFVSLSHGRCIEKNNNNKNKERKTTYTSQTFNL